MTTRRDMLTGGAALAAALVPAKISLAAAERVEATAARSAAFDAAYRSAFAAFEAMVRPSSEAFWAGYNRDVAHVHARETATRQLAALA